MPNRAHLFSLRLGHAFRESVINEPYTRKRFGKDLLAGLTVGIIAIPLAMALAIASGVAPEYGLYTAIIAGSIIALAGGSRYSVSGPTAAFVVILYPIVQNFGLGGLLLASALSGLILIMLAALRLGRLIEYIPESVTLGFTAGIGVVIATLQIKDFFGLPIKALPEVYFEKLSVLASNIPNIDGPSLLVATTTFIILLLWPKLKTPIPGHLPAIIIGMLLALILNHTGFSVATIRSHFTYTLANGDIGRGIPAVLPHFLLPWQQLDGHGHPLLLHWATLKALLPSAFAIAMLGAIESLLCAVVLDNMSGRRHSANSELFGQGLGNIIAPFFGGITATAAIARSAANYKTGAQSPIAAVIHAVVVLLGVVAFAPLLSYLPMASMAALLMMVAINISDIPKIIHFIKTSPRSDILVFFTCLSLTVFMDMVMAITVGIIMAALLFMRNMAEMTTVSDITEAYKDRLDTKSNTWRLYKIHGPLFFAAADKIFSEIAHRAESFQGIVIDFQSVSLIDAGGIAAFDKLLSFCHNNNITLLLCHLQNQALKTLVKAGIHDKPHQLTLYPFLTDAIARITCLEKQPLVETEYALV